MPTGHLIFGSSGALHAVCFDLSEGRITGTPEVVVDDVALTPNNQPMVAVSENGTLAYLPGPYETSLVAVDREGNAVELFREPGSLLWPRYSPDGLQVALTQQVDANRISVRISVKVTT